jgi:hypothetical protein
MKITDYGTNFADYEIDENCHLYKVEVFERVEDAEKGTHTTVAGELVTQDRDMSRNPSSRRTGVALHFYSEVHEPPEDRFVMCIFQHKGGEYIQFKTLSEYEGKAA